MSVYSLLDDEHRPLDILNTGNFVAPAAASFLFRLSGPDPHLFCPIMGRTEHWEPVSHLIHFIHDRYLDDMTHIAFQSHPAHVEIPHLRQLHLVDCVHGRRSLPPVS